MACSRPVAGPLADEVVKMIGPGAVQTISQIRNDLNPNDIIPFLIIIFEDLHWLMVLLLEKHMSPLEALDEWALWSSGDWKHVLVEGLKIAQQFNILKKLGVIQSCMCAVTHIKPMNRILYRMCENFTTFHVQQIRKKMADLNIKIWGHDSPAILLELMKSNAICLKPGSWNLDLFTSILDTIPDLQAFAAELRDYELISRLDTNLSFGGDYQYKPSPCTISTLDDNDNQFSSNCLVEQTSILLTNEKPIPHTGDLLETYPIRDMGRKGVCLIMNQEEFHTIDNSEPLETREGSTADQQKLNLCMTELKFKVFVRDNLSKEGMFSFIKYVIKKGMVVSDSVFMLCILSHGAPEHVFSADGIKVPIEEIQHFVSIELKTQQFNIPIIMFLQVCQIDPLSYNTGLYSAVVDECVVCYATKSGTEIYRQKKNITKLGSLSVTVFCDTISRFTHKLHFLEIVCAFNSSLKPLSMEFEGFEEILQCHNTLSKLLYLNFPDMEDKGYL